jgi:23S rRNA-/tRNA-specific pseudouridylate synthase
MATTKGGIKRRLNNSSLLPMSAARVADAFVVAAAASGDNCNDAAAAAAGASDDGTAMTTWMKPLLPNSLKWKRGDGGVEVCVTVVGTTESLSDQKSVHRHHASLLVEPSRQRSDALPTQRKVGAATVITDPKKVAAACPPVVVVVPESVLRYERQLRKNQANTRSTTPLNRKEHLRILHEDDHVIVTNKPSGVLCVPGLHNKPNLLHLVCEHLSSSGEEKAAAVSTGKTPPAAADDDRTQDNGNSASTTLHPLAAMDIVSKDATFAAETDAPATAAGSSDRAAAADDSRRIVHRLDMDTSGVVVFAKTEDSLRILQGKFRDRTDDVVKEYHALLCGHLPFDRGHVMLPLQRDHEHPPFMRVATPRSEEEARLAVHDLRTHGFKKLVKKSPKPSHTEFRVLGREFLPHPPQTTTTTMPDGDSPGDNTNNGKKNEGAIAGDDDTAQLEQMQPLPVTRVLLLPHTGRTHQLRVHMAALGYPIIGDPAYGLYGEANPRGGCSPDEELPPEGDDVVEDEERRCPHDDWKSTTMKPPSGASLDLQARLLKAWPSPARPMCLHAARLSMKHPMTNEPMNWEAVTPF